MIKKLITLILCITFVISNISVVFADVNETEVTDGNNVAFAKAIGLIDEEISGKDSFTRGELAKLVTRILLYSLSGVEELELECNFTDVDSEYAPYVMTAVNYGILNGVGNGLFMPNENVTYAQLIKAMVAILGRDEEAKAKGGYPTGYMVVAIEQDITRYAPSDINAPINVNAVATVLKQMVNSSLVYVDNNGDVVDYNTSYLWHYCSIKHVSDILESVRGVSIYNQAIDYDVVAVDGEKYKIPDDSMVSPHMLGKRVDVFYEEINGVNTVLYIEGATDGNFVLDAKEIEKASSDGYTYYDGKRERLLSIDSSCIVLYNNKVLGNYTSSDLNPFKNSSKDGNVLLVDSDYDRDYDLVKITAYDSYVVSDVQNGIAFSKSRKFSVDLEKLEKNSVVNLLFEPIDTQTIEEGDILNVLYDKNNNITGIIVTIDSFSGIIDSITYQGGLPESLEVAGKILYCSNSLLLSANISDLKIGASLKMYFNPQGRVCEIDSKGYESLQTAYLIDAKSSDGLDANMMAKLLTSGGEIKVINFAKKVSVTVGNADEGTKSASDAIAYAGKTDGRVKRQPIHYTLNSSGDISRITYPDFDAEITQDGFYQYPDFDGETDLSSYYYRASPKSFGAKLLMGNNTIVLRVAEESSRDNDDLYCLSSPTDFLTGNVNLKLEAYGHVGNNPMADIMIVRVNKDNAYRINAQGQIFTIKSVANGLDADGEEIAKLTVIGQNSETELIADPLAVRGLIAGDVIRYAQDETSIVKIIEKIFSYENMSLVNLANPSQASVSAGSRFLYGTVVYADENSFTVRIGLGDSATYESYPAAGFKKVVVDSSGRKTDVYIGSSELLLGENDYGSLASKVLIHTSSLDSESLIIFK